LAASWDFQADRRVPGDVDLLMGYCCLIASSVWASSMRSCRPSRFMDVELVSIPTTRMSGV
jgi:hypothetical protein